MAEIILKAASKAELLGLLSDLGLTTGWSNLPQPTLTEEDEDDTAPAGPVPFHDKDGLPWDARIHSDKKGQNKDGTWRKRRGVADEFVAQIEAELRANMTGPAGSQPVNIPAMPVATPQAPVTPAVPPMPNYQETPAVPPMPQPAAAPAAMDFGGFMPIAAKAMQTPGANGQPMLDNAYLTGTLYPTFGLTNLGDLNARPDLIQPVVDFLKSQQRWPA